LTGAQPVACCGAQERAMDWGGPENQKMPPPLTMLLLAVILVLFALIAGWPRIIGAPIEEETGCRDPDPRVCEPLEVAPYAATQGTL
jgi:hypothetical protein